jgi:ElaB/YqjD/DUF883 family membrane-anchored ribosome-binding protein
VELEEEIMSDEENKAEAPVTAVPKKPRARKTVAADGAANPASADQSGSEKPANAAPKRKAAAQPAATAAETPAPSMQTPTPNSVELVSIGTAGAGAAAAAHSSGAFGAMTDKVNAMIPEDMTAKAKDAAVEVKDMACDAAHGLARIISDSAGAIDDNIGPKYGDYARTAAQSVTDAAERLRAKPVEEIAEDTKEFVRTKPVAAAGIAAVFTLALAKIVSSMFGKRR